MGPLGGTARARIGQVDRVGPAQQGEATGERREPALRARAKAVWVVLVCALVALVSSSVRAQSTTEASAVVLPAEVPVEAAVVLHPGATCLAPDRLYSRIERWRQQRTVDARIRVDVRGDAVAANRVAFTVTKSDGGRAERLITDAPSDCDQLHAAVALSIALAIDATLTGQVDIPVEAAPIPDPEPTPSPPKLILPSAEAHSDHEEGAARPLFGVFVGGAAALGVVSFDAGFGLSVGARYRAAPFLTLGVLGAFVLGGEQALPETPGHFDASLAALGPELCFVGEASRSLELLACAGVLGGVLSTQGDGYDRSYARKPAWWAAMVGGQLEAEVVDGLAIAVGLRVVAPFSERVILVRGTGGAESVTRSFPRVGAMVVLGPVFRFF